MPTTPNLSDCHQAPVTIGSTDGSTQFYICSICKQACNTFVPTTPDDELGKSIAKIVRSAIGGLNHTRIGYSNEHDYLADPYIDDIMQLLADQRCRDAAAIKAMGPVEIPVDAPMLIQQGDTTGPAMLREWRKGYNSAINKWRAAVDAVLPGDREKSE